MLKTNTLLQSRMEKISRTHRFAIDEDAKAQIANIADSAKYISLEALVYFPFDDIRDIIFSVSSPRGKKTASAAAADLSKTHIAALRLSLCVPLADLPDEIAVIGGEVREFAVKIARVGWENDESVPTFAFGESGGKADFSFSGADFSVAEAIFPLNEKPYILLSLSPCEDYGDISSQTRVRFRYGASSVSIRRAKDVSEAKIYACALPAPYSALELGENAAMVRSLFLKADANLKDFEPLVADPGVIVRWKKEMWRREEYELFRWEQFPEVLLLDIKNYEIQSKFFTRLAFFAEKRGYRGKLMSDSFIAKEKGYNAHDYSAQTLASFFDTAQKTDFHLNEYELLLKRILLENGVILLSDDGKTVISGRGSLLSISQESPVYLRDRLLAHEGWHGIFFSDADFRAFCASLYSSMDRQSRLFMREYWSLWASLNYDTSDETLMHNETMAYLLQQSIGETAQYFMHLTTFKTVQQYIKPLADYVVESEGKGFTAAADRLRNYVYAHYGLSAGRISLIAY